MTEQLSGKLYMNRIDTLKHTGVTPKQLRQWREAGLIRPELGSQPGRELKFTERDLRLLGVIKKLRDEGYPLATIRKMLSETVPWEIDFDTWFWDYAGERWMTQREITQQALATEDIERSLPDLLGMALAVFLWRSEQDGVTQQVRQTRVQEIFDAVRNADRLKGLKKDPLTRIYVQRLLEIRSEKLVRGRSDAPHLLYELERKGEGPEGLWEIAQCEHCHKFFVAQYGGEFCSQECRNSYGELPFE